MADVPIRVGVVGLGAFGVHHARHYLAHPAATLAALADTDFDRARAAADQFGGAPLADWREMIGTIDAVSIAAPASSHTEIACGFIDAGVHVLVEKPIAVEVAGARAIVAQAGRAGIVLQVGHVERFSPAIEELARRVGDPRRISCARRSTWNGRSTDVDVVLDLMIHDIGHVLMLAGSAPVSVSAGGIAVRSGAIDEAEAWLTFDDGLIATLSASRVAEANQRTIVVTEPGFTYRADLAAPALTMTDRSTWGSPAAPILLQPRDALAAEIDAFLDSVATGKRPLVDGDAGLAALELAERIQSAIADSDAPVARSVAQ